MPFLDTISVSQLSQKCAVIQSVQLRGRVVMSNRAFTAFALALGTLSAALVIFLAFSF